MKPRVRLADLPNLGPATTRWLDAVGIRTRADLERVGVIPACCAIRALGHPISVVGAYALQGALLGCPWNALPAALKSELRRGFSDHVAVVDPRNRPVAVRRRPDPRDGAPG